MSFAAYYYPRPSAGAFLSAGAGFSRVEVSAGGSSAGNTEPGFTVGGGYDIRVGTNISIVPTANWVWGHPENGFSQNFFQLSVGITFH